MATAAFTVVVAVVGLIGYLTLGSKEEVIQGQVEVNEYRVSSKVPGRILEIRVKEGDYVKAGDTLVIIDAPDVMAKQTQAESAQSAASAMDEMAKAGARQEQIRGAFEVLQQTKAGLEIAEKSYNRVQRLFDEGVMSEQKRDEAYANYKAMEAQVKAAQSQYDMARNGARREEKMAAAAQVARAKGAVAEVNSYVHEMVQVATQDGEVGEIFPEVGELVGTGSPIMTISVMKDLWATFNVREDRQPRELVEHVPHRLGGGGELGGAGAPIMTVSVMKDLWATFNVREDQLGDMTVGKTIHTFVPAFNKELDFKVYYMKDQGSYATWKATKANGQYDLKTFEVKARPVQKLEGLRPGMSVVIRNEGLGIRDEECLFE